MAPRWPSIVFGETPGRIVFEDRRASMCAWSQEAGFTIIGETTEQLTHLTLANGDQQLVHLPLSELKALWRNGLTPYY